ncbi:MAG TPA: protein kinase [Pseudomonadales bacterium]
MSTTTQPANQTLPIGQQLEDFRIVALLGQGGFGITYKAVEETLQREVAIKEYLPQQFAFRDPDGTVRPRTAEDEEMYRWGLTRFLDEARTLAKFRHPNIVSVMRFFERNGTAYLVMEFEEGMDLGRWLHGRAPPSEERLVHDILAPLLQGLARVHDKGLLHRDIKPGNVFIRRDGSPVLLDFGASRPHGTSSSQLTTIISAGYSPFEQYGTGAHQGPWSDLYALAGTMYRVIAGQPPVDAIARAQGTRLTPAAEVGRGRYSERLLKAIDKALSVDIAERPQDAREFLTLLGIEPPPRPQDNDATFVRPRSDQPTVLMRKPRRWPIVLGGVVGALALAAGAVWWLGGLNTLLPSDAVTTAPPVPPAQEPAPVQESSPAQGQTSGPSAGEPAAAPSEQEPAPATATTQPASEPIDRPEERPAEQPTTPPPAEPEPPSEDAIVAGLGLPADVLTFRHEQIAGALLAFTTVRTKFDTCREIDCSDLPVLLQQLRSTMEPQNWRRGEVQGAISLENPRRLDSESCPFMVDVRERITVTGSAREQLRTYCTSNGFDRVVQDAGDVT